MERSLSAAQRNTPVIESTISRVSLGARVTGEQVERSLSAAQRTHLSLRAVSLGARVTGEQVERSLSAAQRTHLSLRAVSGSARHRRTGGEELECSTVNTPVIESRESGARVTGEQVERSLSAAQRTHLSLRAIQYLLEFGSARHRRTGGEELECSTAEHTCH